ncbi:MAG TPA: hypothetical protein VF619_01415 [Allosphingosinicella sp.]
MYEERLLLHFETAPGQYPDTAIAARALLDWTELVHRTIAVLSPTDRISLEIVGVTAGSTRFPQLMKFLEKHSGNIKEAWSEYPHLKSMVAGAAHTLYTSVVAAGVTLALQPSEQTVRLSDHDRALLEQMGKQAAADAGIRDANKRFYRNLEAEPAITGVGVGTSWEKKPTLIVPRAEFPERGGLWEAQEAAPQVRAIREIWDVVLLKPALVARPQSWQFFRGGLRFSAQMADPQFLLAMKDGRVPLNLREGLMMRVEVEYQESLTDEVWEPVQNTRKIVRVLSPPPLPKPLPDDPRER